MGKLKKISLLLSLILLISCGSENNNWYPFPNSFFGQIYTAGPIALTSNVSKNEIWENIDDLNTSLARMSYVMQLGAPEVNIAWFYQDGAWPDKPNFQFQTLSPNKEESEISKLINLNGYAYDRISTKNLLSIEIYEDKFKVQDASYQVLLLNDLEHASPKVLKKILSIVNSGIPVIYIGDYPNRSTGLSNFKLKDIEVSNYVKELSKVLPSGLDRNDLIKSLKDMGINPLISLLDKEQNYYRSAIRSCGSTKIVYLFNDSDQYTEKNFYLNQSFENIKILDPYNGSIKEFSNQNGGLDLMIEMQSGKSKILTLGMKGNPDNENCLILEEWKNPEKNFFPTLRWWWPGNAVDKFQIESELKRFKEAKFSSIELQTLTIGLPKKHLVENEEKIFQVGEKPFFNNLRHLFSIASQLNLNIDLTLGSGWSSGGPFIDRFPEKQLIKSEIDFIGPGKITINPPEIKKPSYIAKTNFIVNKTIGEFDEDVDLQTVILAKVDTSQNKETLKELKDVTDKFNGAQLSLDLPEGKYRIFFIYQNIVSHNTLGSAYKDALNESLVIDHLNKGGAEEYIEELGEKWIRNIHPFKPRNFFIDSFELIGELPWSEKFFSTFENMHEYNIKPFLPLIFKKYGESKYLYAIFGEEFSYKSNKINERVYEDYLLTREFLFMNEFLIPIKNWMSDLNIKLKLQAHGGYANYLDAYALADIPESEGLFAGGSFDFLKLASSAGNIANRKIISSESFISIDLNPDRLKIRDYERLAGNAFSAGINHIVFHGYPYKYEY